MKLSLNQFNLSAHSRSLSMMPNENQENTSLAASTERIGLTEMNGQRYMLYGSAFIISVDSMMFPLDTIKTIEMGQSKMTGGNTSIIRRIVHIAKREGIPRFWRGIGPSVMGSFPGQAVYYVTYEGAQEAMKMVRPGESSPFLTFVRGFLSGACAEIAAGLFYVPADVVAQRLQVQSTTGFTPNSRLYAGPLDIAKKVLRTEGPRGFFRGYGAYIMAYSPGSAVQWGTYEFFRTVLNSSWKKLNEFTTQSTDSKIRDHAVNGISGGLASFCAIMANNPLEVLRIRTQLLDAQNLRDRETLRQGYLKFGLRIFREEGWTAFYLGLRLRLIISVPSSILAMTGYETIKEWSID